MFHVKHFRSLFAGKPFALAHPAGCAAPVRSPNGRQMLIKLLAAEPFKISTELRNSRILRRRLEFEWDEAKAVENLRKHGVSFAQAALAFRDLLAVEFFDDRQHYGEDRSIHIGRSEGQVMTVAYTEREGDRIRIISAHMATKDEQEYYYSQNPF